MKNLQKNTLIRNIQKSDNPHIYNIIRSVFEEHGIQKSGTAYFDNCLPYMFETYTHPNSAYFVCTLNSKIVGGCGIFPTKNLKNNTCELIKMYLLKEARGLGLGKQLLETCENRAKELGYKKIYLETLSEFSTAIQLYLKLEYKIINQTLGDSGHHSCDIKMLKHL